MLVVFIMMCVIYALVDMSGGSLALPLEPRHPLAPWHPLAPRCPTVPYVCVDCFFIRHRGEAPCGANYSPPKGRLPGPPPQ